MYPASRALLFPSVVDESVLVQYHGCLHHEKRWRSLRLRAWGAAPFVFGRLAKIGSTCLSWPYSFLANRSVGRYSYSWPWRSVYIVQSNSWIISHSSELKGLLWLPNIWYNVTMINSMIKVNCFIRYMTTTHTRSICALSCSPIFVCGTLWTLPRFMSSAWENSNGRYAVSPSAKR